MGQEYYAIVESAHFALFWNGEQLDWFWPGRGIRQGDDMSPYVSVFYVERLSQIIYKELVGGSWKGIKISRNNPLLSHMFFAVYVVLFM